MPEQPHFVWHQTRIRPEDRAAALGQRPVAVWLTGLSGSGKSTLANALEHALHERGRHSFLLDGDNIRHGLNRDLDLSAAGRQENIRRIGEVTRLLLDAGLIVITAFISPYREDRARVREAIGAERFLEVHVRAPLATCEQRDPKGLYARARRGELQGMTGIDDPYEAPDDPDLIIDTDRDSVETATEHLLQALQQRGAI
ncbi:MAG: adenylyl-sulfate kinase [Halorhodospira halophila]|uniref:adenylyl-sulfate kinase n=1 Tax=Halorhodospira TaxID=85108 RepID=UPI00191155F8|nr:MULTISPECIES: adenylyl-sulfate kinase [Halorhodospira]MBK5935286.1 adenylyl-sulfate kinase [Halorhodospira halophila]MCC3751534.1 adenylyl-sulfate kinase [Halorhodospira halophila]MCG5532575.1 adenylyl-sulfate kinase [Halorhodospira sp. 9621]MCG5538066.1 adenylyl-sulfate kinase [Halorhodospira sp. 9622]